jgi:hypothetical protein
MGAQYSRVQERRMDPGSGGSRVKVNRHGSISIGGGAQASALGAAPRAERVRVDGGGATQPQAHHFAALARLQAKLG